jgi:Tetratricopeptide repeat
MGRDDVDFRAVGVVGDTLSAEEPYARLASRPIRRVHWSWSGGGFPVRSLRRPLKLGGSRGQMPGIGSRRAFPVCAGLALAAGLSVCLSSPLAAHEEPHERIARLSARILREPDDPTLYLARGELHRLSRHWREALEDFDRVAALAPNHPTVAFHRGRLLLDAGQPEAALISLERFLLKQPDHTRARIARARALRRTGKLRAAARDYSRALARLPAPTPALLVERAACLVAAGELPEALRGLEAGIDRLGPVPNLELEALGLEMRLGRTDAALARLNRLADAAERPERWLALRGRILELSGEREQALASYSEALRAIRELPDRLAHAPATRELVRELRQRLRGSSP